MTKETKDNQSLFDTFVSLMKATYSNWRNDRTLRLGAGLAYYVVFSLIPILALTVFLASLLFPEEAVISYFREQFQQLFASSGIDASGYFSEASVLEKVEQTFSSLGLFGLVSLLVTSSFAVLALDDSVNIIWGRPVLRGWKNMVKRYVLSYTVVLSFAALLIMLLAVQAVLAFVKNALNETGPVIDFMTSTATAFITWGLIVLALAWLVRVLSDNKVEWVYTIVGSAVTVAFMYIGIKAIGFYISHFSFNSVTSVFGMVLLVLVWVYYESQILLAGFQLTKTLSEGNYAKK